MKIVNFGSLNLDYVYSLPHFVQPGETITCTDFQIFCGGKGLNQSIALARAGAQTVHAGFVGREGGRLKGLLAENGVDTSLVHTVDTSNGHAIIQVEKDGQNSIIVYGGANRALTDDFITEVTRILAPGDYLLMQNETNLTDEAARLCKKRGAKLILNPSPIDTWLVDHFPFDLVDIFILNELEGMSLTGETDPDSIAATLCRQYPQSTCVLTLGEKGALFLGAEGRFFQPPVKATAVDTTGAGDTFTGYFLAEHLRGQAPDSCLAVAAAAAAIAVSKKGAADSIPFLQDVRQK